MIYEWLGIELVEVQIAHRAISYLGHLGRYDDSRWEVQLLGAALADRPGRAEPSGQRLHLRQ
eukprot:6706452-Pyramimonas_sp.AAC.1